MNPIVRFGSFTGSRGRWLVMLSIAAMLLGTASLAAAGDGGRKSRADARAWSHAHRYEHRPARRAHERRHEQHRRARVRHDGRRDHDWYRRSGWHYSGGRYWAPPRYRGRYCHDARHYRGVHYHVAVRDYYDYYYPRYRYHGPRPLSANASVIISIPLF